MSDSENVRSVETREIPDPCDPPCGFVHREIVPGSERGQTLVEYGLLIALIAVVVIVALLFLGPVVSGLFVDIGNTLDGVNVPPSP